MAKNSSIVTASVPRFDDPITTDAAVSILKTLIASTIAADKEDDCIDGNADSAAPGVDQPAVEVTARKPRVHSDRISAAEAHALQPDIVLQEGQEVEEEQEQDGQYDITAARSVGDDRDTQDDEALELLVEGLRTGRLIAAFLDDIATVTIPAAYWATEAGPTTARQGYRLERLGNVPGAPFVRRPAIVSKDDVHALVGAAKPRNRGGRPASYGWEGIMFDIWAYAMKHGIPKTQAQFFRGVAAYLGDREPQSETQLKEKTDRVFKEILKINASRTTSQNP